MRAVPHQPSFVPHPLILLAASLASGILTAKFIAVSLKICLAYIAISYALAVWCFVRQRLGVATLMLVLAFFGAGATLANLEKGGVKANRVQRMFDAGTIASGDPVEMTGALERAPEFAPDGFYLTLRVEKLRVKENEQVASGVVWLFAPVRNREVRDEYEALELGYGARVRVMTALNRAESYRNPGVSSYTEYLEQRGYDATATIKSPLLIERLDDKRIWLPLALLYEWRQRLLTKIDEKFSVETAGVLRAALLGNRYHLSRSAAERFREGGTFHVLVISGMHISFVGGLVLLTMRRITKSRAWQFAISVAFLWSYTFAVGAESSVVRAALMFTVVALAPVLHRHASSLNALGGAALLLLVWRPGNLFDPSFQLTFLSVLAIIAIAWPMLRKMQAVGMWRPTRATPYPPLCARWWRSLSETLFWSERKWKREIACSTYHYGLYKTPWAALLERLYIQPLLRYVFAALVISVSIQALLLPLLILYFHRLSLASVILNVCVGALMAALSLIALVALIVSHMSATLAVPLISLAESLNWLMIHSVDPFVAARVSSVRLPEYTNWRASIYLFYYVSLAALIIALANWNPLRRELITGEHEEKRLRRLSTSVAAVALIFAAIIIVAHPFSARSPDGRLRVDFLDVGQGDAALVTMPDGTTLLIDGGGRPRFGMRGISDEEDNESFERDARSIGEAVVSEYLWWRGLDHVDYILATHADMDHIDGLNDIARNFRPRAALVARAPTRDPEYARFAETMRTYEVPVQLIGRGDTLYFGGVTVEVLWPAHTADMNASSNNDDSLVVRLRFGEKTFLLTGDIEKNAEAALVSARQDLRCDVIKVAHHGSRTSSTESFVNVTRAKVAVISVGLLSPFGHPHSEVTERWRAQGAEILATGKRGTITISTNGRDLKVETFKNSDK